MYFLSKLFLCFCVCIAAVASLAAQENTSTPASSQTTAAVESPPARAESSNLTSTTELSSPSEKAPAPPESIPSTSMTPSPETPPEATPSITPTDPSMIPPTETTPSNTENNPTAPASNEAEQTTTSSAAMPSTESVEKKKQELKVRYYEVRTQVEKEADVSALKEKADHATTDEEKRQELRAYYELLFTKMKKIDASISERCDLMQGAYLRRLEQTSVQPTIPLSLLPAVGKSINSANDTPAPKK
jgi:hypothetical protein